MRRWIWIINVNGWECVCVLHRPLHGSFHIWFSWCTTNEKMKIVGRHNGWQDERWMKRKLSNGIHTHTRTVSGNKHYHPSAIPAPLECDEFCHFNCDNDNNHHTHTHIDSLCFITLGTAINTMVTHCRQWNGKTFSSNKRPNSLARKITQLPVERLNAVVH